MTVIFKKSYLSPSVLKPQEERRKHNLNHKGSYCKNQEEAALIKMETLERKLLFLLCYQNLLSTTLNSHSVICQKCYIVMQESHTCPILEICWQNENCFIWNSKFEVTVIEENNFKKSSYFYRYKNTNNSLHQITMS